jgi:hypothetical protein
LGTEFKVHYTVRPAVCPTSPPLRAADSDSPNDRLWKPVLTGPVGAICYDAIQISFDHLVARGDRAVRAGGPHNGQGTVINLARDVIGRL